MGGGRIHQILINKLRAKHSSYGSTDWSHEQKHYQFIDNNLQVYLLH